MPRRIPRVHRTARGAWASCQDLACAQPYHLPVSVVAARALPLTVLLSLLDVIDPPHVDPDNGERFWTDTVGNVHRDCDLPAKIEVGGALVWYRHGQIHRGEDRPAIILADGTREWWQNNRLIRSNGKPSVVEADGTQEWTRNGVWHRGGDMPAVIRPSGAQEWWFRGTRHRMSGPAIVHANGRREWWQHDQLIRQDPKE